MDDKTKQKDQPTRRTNKSKTYVSSLNISRDFWIVIEGISLKVWTTFSFREKRWVIRDVSRSKHLFFGREEVVMDEYYLGVN